MLKLKKKVIIMFALVIMGISGCAISDIYYPMYTNLKKTYLFTRNQKIIFLGFFGKNRKQFMGKEYSKVLESWLMKRPLYQDISTAEINREKLPKLEQIRSLSNLNKSKRILIIYTDPTLKVCLYTFGKSSKHNKFFHITTIPLLPQAHDLELALGSVDLVIQPAASIFVENALSSTIVLPKNSAREEVKTYAVLSHLYMENPEILTYARVVNRRTATVLDMQDWSKGVVLKKGYFLFPFVHSERMNMLKKKYCKKLKTAHWKAPLGMKDKGSFIVSNDWLANTFYISSGFVSRTSLSKGQEDPRDRKDSYEFPKLISPRKPFIKSSQF